MTAIIKPAVTQEELNRWYIVSEQLTKLKDEELELRKKIFGATFTAPKEGVNKKDLTDGWIIKGDYKISRTIDVATLTNMAKTLAEHKLPMEDLIRYKPELVLSAYRTLNEEQRKEFDQILVIKEGTPGLEIVKPKRS
jgi:hypothetical protein